MTEYQQNQDALLQQLQRHKVIAILRHTAPEQAGPIFDSLYEGGIRLIEITMNSRGAAGQINRQTQRLGRQMLIGAGTVTTPQRAESAIEAGARFLVTPNLDLAVLAAAARHNIPVIPGVMTPSEMMTAVAAGASVLKLFPASQLGTDYVKAVLAPLDDVKLVAVGGVSAANAAEWINAGCVGVGIGGSLLDPDLIRQGEYEKLSVQIAAMLKMIQR